VTLLLAGVSLLTISPPAPSAVAAEPAPVATVTLDEQTSTSLSPDGSLVLSGVVTNVGDGPLRRAQVLSRWSLDPLDSTDDITRVADDESFRTGRRNTSFIDAIEEPIAAGQSRPFRIEIPVDDLNLPEQGVYVVGVDVRAQPQGRSRADVASERTVVPYVTSLTLPAVPTAMLWSLTDKPSMLPDGALATDGLASALARGGRLGNIVASGVGAPVSWLIDPDLVDTALDMADGYVVQAPPGAPAQTPEQGTGQAAATAWLAALDAVLSGKPFVGALPVADADLVAAVRQGGADTKVVGQAVVPAESLATTLSRVPKQSGPRGSVVSTGLIAPAGGAIDESTAEAVAAAGGSTLVLGASSVENRPDGVAATLDTGSRTLDVVVTDPVVDAALAAAATPGEEVQARQRLVSAAALHAVTAADEGSAPVPLVGQAPRLWSPTPAGLEAVLRAWTGTPWTRAVPLDQAVSPDTAGAATTRVELDYGETEQARELTGSQLAAVDRTRQQMERFGSVLVEPRETRTSYDQALLRGLSAGWRGDEPGTAAFLGAVETQARQSLEAVRVGVPAKLTLSGRTGRFPVSIENGLPQAVRVGLRFTSANPDRLTVPDVPAQVIEPGETAQVLVEANAVTNGSVDVSVRPVTADGVAISAPTPFVVKATNYDTIGWIVVGGAVTVLFGAAAVRLVRRARRARRSAHTTAEQTTVAREREGVL